MHKHKAKVTTMRGYSGTAAGAHYTPRGEERRAHGGVCHVERCSCGATRETNSNGRYDERGTWQEPDESALDSRIDAHGNVR